MTLPDPQAIANSIFLTFLSRMVQLIGIPAGLGLLSWGCLGLVNLQSDMAALKATIQARIETAQIREQIQDNRIGALEQHFIDYQRGRP